MYRQIRAFFEQRNLLEVDVPLLYPYSHTALHLDSFQVDDYYLQTSPELLLKRLLAAGYPDCYYLGKAFRQAEISSKHNSEFTMLEWYRIGFDEMQLAAEVVGLIQSLIKLKATEYFSYRSVFETYLSINPHTVDDNQLVELVNRHTTLDGSGLSTNDLLNWLMSDVIEPQLAQNYANRLVIVNDFPSTQAEMARTTINQFGDAVSQRFEVYLNGIELANGYWELNDAQKQRQRMLDDNQQRWQLAKKTIPIDDDFIAAVANLPNCAGVALGVDRLLQIVSKASNLHQTLSFSNYNLD